MTEILTTIGCEPGSEECGGCEHRQLVGLAEDLCFCELRKFTDDGGDFQHLVNAPDGEGGFMRTPSCLAGERKARELREEAATLRAKMEGASSQAILDDSPCPVCKRGTPTWTDTPAPLPEGAVVGWYAARDANDHEEMFRCWLTRPDLKIVQSFAGREWRLIVALSMDELPNQRAINQAKLLAAFDAAGEAVK